MPRLSVPSFTPEAAVERALRMLTLCVPGSDGVHRPLGYRLKPGHNGGLDPDAEHCGQWSYGERQLTADCIGFTLWCSGLNRRQPEYQGPSGEWLDCGAVWADANGDQQFSRGLYEDEEVRPGDWCVSRGHIELVICRGGQPPPGRPWLTVGANLAIHRPRLIGLRASGGLSVTNKGPWASDCIFTRPQHYHLPLRS